MPFSGIKKNGGMQNQMIKVMIVDDSKTVRELLQSLLERDSNIEVSATAQSAEEALEILKSKTPDIITMDLHLPGMSGLSVTEKIMSERPVPIIIVTADSESALQGFKLIEAGAVAVLETPPAPGHPQHRTSADLLLRTVKSLAGVKLVRRTKQVRRDTTKLSGQHSTTLAPRQEKKIVLIGASTGGPQTIKNIVDELPPNFAWPIVCVQHMAHGFLPGFVSWLNESKTVKAKIIQDQEIIEPGCFYLAPDDYHLGLKSSGKAYLSSEPKEYGMRPSVSFLYRSVASFAHSTIAILLTGMGRDGAEEMGIILKKGGLTIAQDQASSIVFGMPAEAIALGNASEVLPANMIAARLRMLARNTVKDTDSDDLVFKRS
jgi:two-component system chemotaxis response regulator CheB